MLHKLSAAALTAALTACAATAPQTIEIAKSDGSRQCGGEGIPPAQMQAAQLQGIAVSAARKDSLRGVNFAAVCGGETGKVNVFTIAAKDWALAQQRGFTLFE